MDPDLILQLQYQFSKAFLKTNAIPEVAQWYDKIKAAKNPEDNVYIITHSYKGQDGNSYNDSFLLIHAEINWPNQDETTFREVYFRASNSDPTIWDLKSKFRTHSTVLQTLLLDPTLIA